MNGIPSNLLLGDVRLSVDSGPVPGVPVFFQHGLCGDAHQTAEAFPTDVPFRRVTLECRGHGRSDLGPVDQLSIATFADDLASLIETVGTAPAIIGGISMGAAIAMRLAVRRPELVRGLILARPAWVTESAPANMRPNGEIGALLAQDEPDARGRFLAGPTAVGLRDDAPDNLVSLLGFFDRQPRWATAALLECIAADGPGIDPADLGRLSIPTLVIGHARDVVHPLAQAEQLASMIPGADLAVITPKATDKVGYLADFHQAMKSFLLQFD